MKAKSATDSGRKKLNAGQIDVVALLQTELLHTDEGANIRMITKQTQWVC
jgi:hypothetical protein